MARQVLFCWTELLTAAAQISGVADIISKHFPGWSQRFQRTVLSNVFSVGDQRSSRSVLAVFQVNNMLKKIQILPKQKCLHDMPFYQKIEGERKEKFLAHIYYSFHVVVSNARSHESDVVRLDWRSSFMMKKEGRFHVEFFVLFTHSFSAMALLNFL